MRRKRGENFFKKKGKTRRLLAGCRLPAGAGTSGEMLRNTTGINKAGWKQEVTRRRGMSRAVCRVASQDLPTVSMQLPLPPMARGVARWKKRKKEEKKKARRHVDGFKDLKHQVIINLLPAWETAHQAVTSERLICKRIHIYGECRENLLEVL